MKRHLLIAVGAAIILSACSRTPFLYRVDVPQGNIYEQSTVEQIRPGMTRTQVRRLLGTPLLADPFRQNQDSYIYRFTSGKSNLTYRKDLNIYYDQANRVIDIKESELTTERK
ncbi:outer membrane protein assembly factor BamE [Cardiobacteriaceae bacterium TAE3-ERU3]|nr:outer membrane protein assembly factor BamE [Cardiobacteriaceae bacterium TAE3-ERU3]